MKQLKKYFEGVGEVRGYSFKQISSIEGLLYVYEVKGVNTTHYEVFRHVENKRFNCISYPRSAAFGIWAWTCSNPDSVVSRTDLIINQ